MPANKKYLSTPFQRFLKITAGFIGGYAVMLSFHVLLTSAFKRENIIITSAFTGYILWAILLLLAFLANNGWKIWGLYILLALLFASPYLFNR
jgi:zinc transporter ZupT